MMNAKLRPILLAAFLILGITATVTYTACQKDHCNNVACLNGGSCDGGNCVCPVGFEGNRCEIITRDKFVGNYNGGDSCSVYGASGYPIHLFAVLDNPREMVMKNFINVNVDSAICTMQSIDSFTFTGNNNSTTYSGTGIISNDSLRMSYHVQHDTINYDCHYQGLKY